MRLLTCPNPNPRLSPHKAGPGCSVVGCGVPALVCTLDPAPTMPWCPVPLPWEAPRNALCYCPRESE